MVPTLLGFRPEASLVVIGTEPPRDRVKVVLRYDLPDPPGLGVSADLAAHAVGILRSQRLATAVAIGYGPPNLVDLVVTALREATEDADIELLDILRVSASRYWSYLCRDEDCCPPAGVPFDPEASPSVPGTSVPGRATPTTPGEPGKPSEPARHGKPGKPAETGPQAQAGAQAPPPPLASRAAVAARIAPLGGITAESMRQATRRAERHVSALVAKVRSSARLGAARQAIAAEGLAAVGSMITTYRAGGTFATDYQVARLTVALRDLRVRDDAWARMDPAHAGAHRLLWTDVTRRAQPGYVAAPAALLAFVAWQSGDGALANIALDRSLADDPQYSMALLLRQVITAGAPPSLARLPMTPAEVAASYDEAEASPGGSGPDDRDDDGTDDAGADDEAGYPGYDHEPDPDVRHPDPGREP